MTTPSVDSQVAKIVSEQLGVAADKVTPESDFVKDLGADSLDTVELVMALEEEFDIEIPDEASGNIRTVGDAIAYIKKQTETA